MLAGHGWPPSHYVCAPPRPGAALLPSPQEPLARLHDALRGRPQPTGRLWFFGDSISALHFWATVCALGGEVDPTIAAPKVVQRRASASAPDGGRNGTASSSAQRPPLCVPTRAGTPLAVSISAFCFQAVKKRREARPATVLRSLQASGQLRASDVLTANLGLHYGSTSNLEALRRDTRELLDAYANLPKASRPLLLWRETSPEGFPTPTGEYPHQRGQAAFARDAACRSAPVDADAYNRATAPILAAVHVPVVAIHNASRSRPFELRGWRTDVPGPRGRPTLDCVHYCLPSATLDYWVGAWAAALARTVEASHGAPLHASSDGAIAVHAAGATTPPPTAAAASAASARASNSHGEDAGGAIAAFEVLGADQQTVQTVHVHDETARAQPPWSWRREEHTWRAEHQSAPASPLWGRPRGRSAASGRPRNASASVPGAEGAGVEAPPLRCVCFSTCTRDAAAAFLESYVPRTVHESSSPWYSYLTAVYRSPPPLPFAASRLRFFYHHDPAYWPPGVEWPMATCSMLSRRADGNASGPSCPEARCARWRIDKEHEEAAAAGRLTKRWHDLGVTMPSDGAGTAAGSARLQSLILIGHRLGRSRGSLLVLQPFSRARGNGSTSAGGAGNPPTANVGPPTTADRLFSLPTSVGLRRAWPSGSEVEVMRVDYDDVRFVRGQRRPMFDEGAHSYGVWFYAAVGSGIWLSLGRTLAMTDAHSRIRSKALNVTWAANATIDHAAAQRDITTIKQRRKGHELWPLHAAGLGFDTVQNLAGNGPLYATEIVAVSPSCMHGPVVHACTPQLALKTGAPRSTTAAGAGHAAARDAPTPMEACDCDEAEPYLNCRGIAEQTVAQQTYQQAVGVAPTSAPRSQLAAWPYWSHRDAFYLLLAK